MNILPELVFIQNLQYFRPCREHTEQIWKSVGGQVEEQVWHGIETKVYSQNREVFEHIRDQAREDLRS